MADTNTPNLALLIADLNDTFNFGAHVEANFTTIDALMGAVQCTSTARPTNTYAGQIIYETDSKRYAQNTGTKASPAWTYMSHQAYAAASSARPTVGLTAGELLFETDNNLVRPRGSSAWLSNLPTCTSSARPANPVTGDMAVETDTGRVIWWSGSTWLQKAYANYACTSATHPSSPFTGLEIYETDTGMSAVYSGSSYQYGIQQIAPTQTVSSAASVTFSGIPSVKRLLVLWRFRLATATVNDLEMQVDADAGAHYNWSKCQTRAGVVSGADGGGSVSVAKIGVVSGDTANYGGNGAIWIDGWNLSTAFATYTANSSNWDASTSYWCETYSGIYGVAGPHTSLRIFPAASTLTGEATLYGVM